MRERLYYRCETLNDSDTMPDPEDRRPCAKEEANLIGSLCNDGTHMPVIDIDLPCELVPSSTKGHFHLYIDAPMLPETYLRLIAALADAGIVSHFYAKACAIRGQSFCRVPWVKKDSCRPTDASTPTDT